MRSFIPVLLAASIASFLDAQPSEIAKARLLEKEGDAMGARAVLRSASTSDPEAQLAYAEFLHRHRDPEARQVYERVMGQLDGQRRRVGPDPLLRRGVLGRGEHQRRCVLPGAALVGGAGAAVPEPCVTQLVGQTGDSLSARESRVEHDGVVEAAVLAAAQVAEEEAAAGILPAKLGEAFFLVDPLDGTKEFVKRSGDFTVNIALVRNGVPEVGVVYAPSGKRFFAGRPGLAELVELDANNEVSARRPIAVRAGRAQLTIVASRSHRTPETDSLL